MAFPRSFRSQTWFFRLSTGELEVATGEVVERSFKFGVVDPQTPVRAVGDHVWTTLSKAACLEEADGFASLSPVAVESMPPPPDLVGEASWRVGSYSDETALRSRTPRRVALAFAFVAAAAVFAFGPRHAGLEAAGARSAAAGGPGTGAALAGAMRAPAPAAGHTMASPLPPAAANEGHANGAAEAGGPGGAASGAGGAGKKGASAPRLTKQQLYKLHEADWARRFGPKSKRPGRRHTMSRTPIVAPTGTPGTPTPAPESGDASRWDPLNGAL